MTFRTIFQAYLRVTILNVILISGGFLAGVAYRDRAVVNAQSFEDISPAISAGSAAFGTLLAGRLAADEASVRGIDLLKLQEATLNLIGRKTLTPVSELQAVVDSAKVARPLRMKPEAPKPELQKELPPATKKEGKQ